MQATRRCLANTVARRVPSLSLLRGKAFRTRQCAEVRSEDRLFGDETQPISRAQRDAVLWRETGHEPIDVDVVAHRRRHVETLGHRLSIGAVEGRVYLHRP